MNDIHPDILELLAARATEGLNAEQTRRLQELLAEHGQQDTADLDLAAAAAANAFGLESARDADDAPEALKVKLRTDADSFFGERDGNVATLRPEARSAAAQESRPR